MPNQLRGKYSPTNRTRTVAGQTKNKKGSLSTSHLDEVPRFLLQRRAGNRWDRTVQGVADHARFVGEESALTSGADTLRYRRSDERVSNRSTSDDCTGRCECVSRLVTAAQNRVNQAGGCNR